MHWADGIFLERLSTTKATRLVGKPRGIMRTAKLIRRADAKVGPFDREDRYPFKEPSPVHPQGEAVVWRRDPTRVLRGQRVRTLGAALRVHA